MSVLWLQILDSGAGSWEELALEGPGKIYPHHDAR
jgi:hypothetical protein